MFSFGLTDLQAAKKAPTPPSIAMDEDAQKRNTDCIYFLASPLTCKKGKNCEYRHSEAARTNPRDCWYWKSGNCLNAHCSFRHLPLEGKPGSSTSVASTSTAPTMPQSVSATSTAAAAGPNKSKTPCYFFSQGYCAKNDKCTFMHGLPVASSTAPAEAPVEQNSVNGVNSKAGHSSGGRPLIVLKQSGVISQEVRPPVTNGRSEALNETHLNSSRPSVSVQGVPQSYNSVERAKHRERVANFFPFSRDEDSRKSRVVQVDRFHDVPDLANRSRQSKANKNILQDQANCQGLAQAGDFRNQSGFQLKALRKDGPTGGVSRASPPGSEEGEYSSLSDSRKRLTGLSNSPVQNSDDNYRECKGQRVESEGDLRNHLAKRMKVNSSLHSSMGKGGHPGVATQRHGGARLSNDHSRQKKQQQGVAEADFNGVEGTQFMKRGSSDVPIEAMKQSFKKVQSRSFAVSQPLVDHPKAQISEKRVPSSSNNVTSKSSPSENVKETITFAGPKSLAQIKAEKMAGGTSASKAIGRLDSSSTTTSESGLKLAMKKLACVPAESRDAAASNDKLLTTCMGVVSIIKKDDVLEHETANSEEFEGRLSAISKRKRELESGSNVKETMPGPTEVQASMLKSFREEVEDGEFCEDDDNSDVGDLQDTCTLVSSQEDFAVANNAKEEVSQGLQRLSGEAAEFETESSEDGSKLEVEMEENAYGGGEDYEIDDDDDDEDDFAKKLGRFFGLSNE